MTRFRLLLVNEFRLFRTSIPMHIVAIVQPTVMYLLMTTILVHPTFDMMVTQPNSREGQALVAAMEAVGSPIGSPYIEPILVAPSEGPVARQQITVEERNGVPTAVQRFGLIDSNLVKNFRNRLTAAAIRLWNEALDGRAVVVEERPWLPRDVPYTVYFGMAALPLAAFMAASVTGGLLTAQEFEFQTIVEYRLSPVPVGLILGARLTRLVLTALVAVGIQLTAVGTMTGSWPDSLWRVGIIMVPVAVIAGGLGVTSGLLLRKSIPSFLIGLVASFVLWLLGGAFGLAAGFSRWYETLSRFVPQAHAVELVFPHYYGTQIGAPALSFGLLVLFCGGMLVLVTAVYHWRVVRQR